LGDYARKLAGNKKKGESPCRFVLIYAPNLKRFPLESKKKKEKEAIQC